MFDSLKKSLGMSKTQSKGHVLGSREDNEALQKQNSASLREVGDVGDADEFITFDIQFTDDKLGMGVDPHECGNGRRLPIVTYTTAGSQAAKFGVLTGDIVVALEGNNLSNFDDFYNFIQAIGRPVTVSFQRKKVAPTTMSSLSKNFMAAMPTISMPKYSSTSSGGDASPKGGLSEEERQQRRDMLTRAADERNSSWDKKLSANKNNKNKQKDSQPDPLCAKAGQDTQEEALRASNPETQRVIEKTKQLELSIEKSMGYSPFRPHMSFSGNSSSTIGNPVAATAGGSGSGSAPSSSSSPMSVRAPENSGGGAEFGSEEEYEDFMVQLVSAVDDSFAMLLSLGADQQEVAKVAVHTVYKMLLNLSNNKSELKLRSIRASNKVFQAKVANVPGGVEMLIAAGYVLSDKTQVDEDAGALLERVCDSARNEDLYLTHSMDRQGEIRLGYTLTRIKELVDSTSQQM